MKKHLHGLRKNLQKGSNTMKDVKYVAHSDDMNFGERVKELLLYRKIVKAEKISDQDGVLTLDNGTRIIVEGNEGCGGCENGWYYLDEINGCDNAITSVECEISGDEDVDVYNIFVYAEDKRINCVQYSGSDNGFYGTGYHLFVKIDAEALQKDRKDNKV